MKGTLFYVSFQATVEGQAGFAHVHEIIRGLEKRGWQVSLFEPMYRANGKPLGMWGRVWPFLKLQARVITRMGRADMLYVRGHFAAFPIALHARAFGVPTVFEVNGPYEDMYIAWPWTRRFAPIFQWMFRKQLAVSNAVVAVTPQLAEWVWGQVRHPAVHVIPNGANTDLFRPQLPPKAELKQPYVVFFGALARWQGIDTILNAAGRKEWPEELELVIAGDGVERYRVEQAAASNPRVKYVGLIPYREVPSIVSNSIAGLSPQNSLGRRSDTGLFTLKFFETLACGVPIVLTESPGQGQFVKENDCGIVIPQDDPDALAKAVRLLFENPSLRIQMGLRGRELVERDHSWDRRSADTEVILQELLAGKQLTTPRSKSA